MSETRNHWTIPNWRNDSNEPKTLARGLRQVCYPYTYQGTARPVQPLMLSIHVLEEFTYLGTARPVQPLVCYLYTYWRSAPIRALRGLSSPSCYLYTYWRSAPTWALRGLSSPSCYLYTYWRSSPTWAQRGLSSPSPPPLGVLPVHVLEEFTYPGTAWPVQPLTTPPPYWVCYLYTYWRNSPTWALRGLSSPCFPIDCCSCRPWRAVVHPAAVSYWRTDGVGG